MISGSISKPFFHIGTVITLTALIGLFIGNRMQQRGQWLPDVPTQSDIWTATDVPLDSVITQLLGNPKTLGREYKNTFGESIEAQIIATESFDAYYEPPMCQSGYGYTLTAQQFPTVFGPGKRARALVLKQEESGIRILMLYWVQYADGRTSEVGDVSASSSLSNRFLTGWDAITTGKQSVIVRVYTYVAPDGENAAQSKRNLYALARSLYKSIAADGADWTSHKLATGKGTGDAL